MSHTLVVRPLSALAVILAGSALLAAPVMAGEEEAQAQEEEIAFLRDWLV
ncbi:hypothetical protein [Halomonas alkalisoli]|nr:hypothetical protein [Halomonas alkalisoli]MCE9683938.1 hypothetical protein [Halomonas alkalisoli]